MGRASRRIGTGVLAFSRQATGPDSTVGSRTILDADERVVERANQTRISFPRVSGIVPACTTIRRLAAAKDIRESFAQFVLDGVRAGTGCRCGLRPGQCPALDLRRKHCAGKTPQVSSISGNHRAIGSVDADQAVRISIPSAMAPRCWPPRSALASWERTGKHWRSARPSLKSKRRIPRESSARRALRPHRFARRPVGFVSFLYFLLVVIVPLFNGR